jgi:hypothetical protein
MASADDLVLQHWFARHPELRFELAAILLQTRVRICLARRKKWLEPQMKKLQKSEMADFLAQDPDFERCKSILEEYYDGESGFHYLLLPKFWCNFAWVENYWNDCKRITREQCDYTLPNLKRTFPLALETACPPDFIRNYMRKCQRLYCTVV